MLDRDNSEAQAEKTTPPAAASLSDPEADPIRQKLGETIDDIRMKAHTALRRVMEALEKAVQADRVQDRTRLLAAHEETRIELDRAVRIVDNAMGAEGSLIRYAEKGIEDAKMRARRAEIASKDGISVRIPGPAARMMEMYPEKFGLSTPVMRGRFEHGMIAKRMNALGRRRGGVSGHERPNRQKEQLLPSSARFRLEEYKWGPKVLVKTRDEAEELYDAVMAIYVHMLMRTKGVGDAEIVADAQAEVATIRARLYEWTDSLLAPFFTSSREEARQWSSKCRRRHERNRRDFQENDDRATAMVRVPKAVAEVAWLYGGSHWTKIEELFIDAYGPLVPLTEAEMRDLHAMSVRQIEIANRANCSDDDWVPIGDLQGWRQMQARLEEIMPDLKPKPDLH